MTPAIDTADMNRDMVSGLIGTEINVLINEKPSINKPIEIPTAMINLSRKGTCNNGRTGSSSFFV